MSHGQPQFKQTQIFDWDAEPSDERPSEFVQSTGYSVLSGYYSTYDTRAGSGQLRRRKTGGVNLVLVAAGVFVGMGAAALMGILHFIRS
jgi:hypothetical protein